MSAAAIVVIAFTSVWFGAEHYSLQGLAGVQQATVVGLASAPSSPRRAACRC